MKASVEEITPVKKRVWIEVDSGEVEKKIEKAFREVGKKAKIPGFRPGKIPRQILESRFGNQVLDEVANDLINETFPKALEELETYPIGIPTLEKDAVKRGEGFKYSAVMEVRPQFELKSEDYQGVEVEKRKPQVTDEDVQARLDQIRKGNGKLKQVEDRPIRMEDYVALNYEAFEGDQPIEGIKAENFFLRVGSNDFHAQFESGLVGLNKGDEATVSVDFEEDYYHSRLAGKSVRFKVKVVDVKEVQVPELTDEFAQALDAGFKDLEDLRQKVRETIQAEEEKKADREMKQKLIQKIAEAVDFELPEILVESEIGSSVENIKQNLLRGGSTLEKAGISEAKLKEDLKEPSRRRVKETLILAEIAQQNNLQVDEEELSEGYRRMAAASGQEAEILKKYYEARNLVGSLRQSLVEEKTLNYLTGHASIKEVDKNAAP